MYIGDPPPDPEACNNEYDNLYFPEGFYPVSDLISNPIQLFAKYELKRGFSEFFKSL